MLALLLSVALAAEPVLLDAGPYGTPLQEGLSRLHVDGCDDPRVTWTTPPRGADADDEPDPVAADWIDGGTLHLDLPEGDWVLWVMQGAPGEHPRWRAGIDGWGVRADDVPVLSTAMPATWADFVASPQHAVAPRPVFRPGETAWDRQVAPAHPWQEATVHVGPDGLTLEAFGRPLQGLVAWPAADRPLGVVRLALVDAARQSWWRAHVVGDGIVDRQEPPARPGPLAVQVGLLDARPDPDHASPDARAQLDLARGDRTSRLLFVHGGDDAGTVTVTAPDGVHVDVGEASWLDATGHPDRRLRPRPTVVWPGASWAGGQGLPPALLVTVRTDAATPAGRHPVALTLHRGEEAVTVRLDVVVHDLVPDPAFHAGLFAQVPPEIVLRDGHDAPAAMAVIDDLFGLMTRDGLDAVSLRYTDWDDRLGWVPEADRALFPHAASVWNALGNAVMVWADPKVTLRSYAYVGDGDVLPPSSVPIAQAAFAMARAATTPTMAVWVHMWEEEGLRRLDAVPRGEAFLARLRAAGGDDIPLMGTLATPVGRHLAPSLDVAFVQGTGRDLEDGLAAARDAGAVAWAYNLAPGQDGPWLAWAAGADGLLQWHASAAVDDPFDQTGRKPAWTHTVLGPDGRVHATVQLEAFADGVADVRVLRAVAAQRRRSRAADALLASLRDAVLDSEPAPASDGALLTATTFALARAQVLAATGRVPK
ncbi:MAG: hypothetical protein H6733_09740 [Alphaproteobacteria bacterium]|nr:hypothetical protein [Alphaproteobacteria bacterium]